MAAADTATFQINLESNAAGTAESAQKALEDLRSTIDRDTKALAQLQKAMRNIQGGTTVNIQQYKALKAQIDAKKASIAQAQGAIIDLGGTLTQTRKPSSKFTETLQALQKQAQGVGGPLGGVVGQFGALRGLLAGGAIALGVVAIAAGLALLVTAAVAATAALLKYGIAQANARRAELLRLEGLTKLRSVWGLAAGNATEIQRAIDDVSGSTALGRDEINKYAVSLYKAGLRGDNLSAALEATAIKAATQGDQAAQQWAGLAAGIALSGGAVRKYADNVKARLGGIAAKQMLDLNVQTQKLKENFGGLFADLKIEGFLRGLKSITDLFSQSTASGKALKTLVEVVFQPMITVLEFLMPLGKRFFQGMILGAQAIVIAVLKAALWIKKSFGGLKPDLDLATVALTAGKAAVTLLVVAFGVLAGIVASLAIPFAAFGAQIYAAYKISRWFWGAVFDGYEMLTAVDWTTLGTSITQGIVDGLRDGAQWVLDAIKNLGERAWGTFKKTLGIASPSKEFAKLGVQLPAGVQQGIEQGAPDLQTTVSEMVATPRVPASVPSSGDGSTNTTTNNAPTFNFAITVNTDAKDAQGIIDGLEPALEKLFSGLLLQTGAA